MSVIQETSKCIMNMMIKYFESFATIVNSTEGEAFKMYIIMRMMDKQNIARMQYDVMFMVEMILDEIHVMRYLTFTLNTNCRCSLELKLHVYAHARMMKTYHQRNP